MSRAGQEQGGVSLCDPNCGKIDEETNKMKRNGGQSLRLQKNLPDDATVTQAECTAASEAAIAICCPARTGSVCFDLEGNLIEDDKNMTRKRDEMEEDLEERGKLKEKNSRLPNSSSTSRFADYRTLLKRDPAVWLL